jgi:hypothetical protein
MIVKTGQISLRGGRNFLVLVPAGPLQIQFDQAILNVLFNAVEYLIAIMPKLNVSYNSRGFAVTCLTY